MYLDKLLSMDIDKFEEYLFEDNNNLIKHRIENTEKTIDELYEEMIIFDKTLLYSMDKYNLHYHNLFSYITNLCVLNKKDLLPLILIFLIDYEYLYSLNKHVKNKEIIERFLYIQEEIKEFEKIIKESRNNDLKYNKILKSINKQGNLNNDISKEKLDFIKKVFNKYISLKTPLDTNIEYIHSLLIESIERQALYPLILLRILIKFKAKICKEDIFVNLNSILKYKEYSIILDNGKNFKTYENYINLFLEILEEFSDICDKNLCMYGFYKSSNLVEWIFRSTLNKEVFSDTLLAKVEEKYISVFQDESIYSNYIDTTEYIDFKIDGIKNNEFFSTIVEKELLDYEVMEFMDNYKNDNNNNKILIEKIRIRIFKKFNLEIDNKEDEFAILRCFEIALINRADNYIKDNIIRFIEKCD